MELTKSDHARSKMTRWNGNVAHTVEKMHAKFERCIGDIL
jgi:hypothetical protein